MMCEVYRIEIEERAAGDGLSVETSRHVGVCARCRELYEQRAGLERLLGELKRVEAPNDFEFRLRARLAEGESKSRPWLLRRGFVPGVVSIALAALFFVAATLTLQLRPRVNEEPASRAAKAPAGASEQQATVKTDESDAQRASEVATGGEQAALRDERRGVERARRRVAVVAASVAQKDDGASRLRRERFGSAESEFRPAPYVNSSGSNQIALANPPVAVPLQASTQPLKVVLSDERGGARVVHMKTVSFGAQQLVGRTKESARVAHSTQEGAW